MALILPVQGISPTIGNHGWIAPNASLIGDIIMGEYCTVWFNAVIRGDVNSIEIGHHTNIQDGVVIHCTYQKHKTVIGNHVSIGHNAIVHGCTVHDHVLVGMGAIIMDGVVVGEGSIIAAGAIVTQGTHIPAGSIYAGNPARMLKEIGPEHKEMIERTAKNYITYSSWFKENKESDF
jgi:carbonic anhydrase/acetyltransferase-like protein (isoleucine patch superfamily)